MGSDTYGVVEAQIRFRQWMPQLKTTGQRAVYGAMLGYFGIDGRATPTARQLAALTRFTSRSVRRIIVQLEEIGALMRVGERPVVSSDGVARGGRVVIWSIPIGPLEDLVGEEPQEDREPVPIGPRSTPNRTPEGPPLKVEKLKAADCLHRPIDTEGYCTACGTWPADRDEEAS